MVLARLCVRSTIKIDLKNSLYPYRHFTEQLVGVFGKSPRESDLNHESSFDPVTQEQDRLLPCNNSQAIGKSKSMNGREENQSPEALERMSCTN
jgi:hypothetical protein